MSDELQDTAGKEPNPGLFNLLTQFFNYFRTLTEEKYELNRSVEIARAMFEIRKEGDKTTTKTETVVKKYDAQCQTERDRFTEVSSFSLC